MLSLRAATLYDAPAVVALWRAADAEPTPTDDVHSVRQLVTRDPEALILATEDGGLVGSVIAAWDGWRGSISRLVVAPSHRRKGLGRQLVRAAEDRLKGAGAARLQAIVVETDRTALAFWRASGWQEQVERVRFVKG